MKEIDLGKIQKLSKQVEELSNLLKNYFKDQRCKQEEKLMEKFTHEEKMAYLKGKGASYN